MWKDKIVIFEQENLDNTEKSNQTQQDRMEMLSAKKTNCHMRIFSAICSQMMWLRFKMLFSQTGEFYLTINITGCL